MHGPVLNDGGWDIDYRRLTPGGRLDRHPLVTLLVLTSSTVARFSYLTLKVKHKAKYSLDMCSYAPK